MHGSVPPQSEYNLCQLPEEQMKISALLKSTLGVMMATLALVLLVQVQRSAAQKSPFNIRTLVLTQLSYQRGNTPLGYKRYTAVTKAV